MWIFYVAISACALVAAAFIGKKKLTTTHEVQKTGLVEEEKNRQARKAENAASKESKRVSRRSLDAEKRLSGGAGRSTPDRLTEKVVGDNNV